MGPGIFLRLFYGTALLVYILSHRIIFLTSVYTTSQHLDSGRDLSNVEISEDQQMRTHGAIYSDFAVARQSATRMGRDSRQGESAKLYSGKTDYFRYAPSGGSWHRRVAGNLTQKQGCFVAKSCPTFCDPMDCSPPGSSLHGISQARLLEWVAISFCRGSSRPRDQPMSSALAGGYLPLSHLGSPEAGYLMLLLGEHI